MLPLPCMLVCTFVCAKRTRDRGCSKHPVFPAPSNFRGGQTKMQTSDAMRREKAKVRLRRMGGAKRYPSPHAPALMGIASLHPSYGSNDEARLIPRDDLALFPMDGLGIDQVTTPAAHQEFRAAGADRVVAAAAGGRFAVVIFRQ